MKSDNNLTLQELEMLSQAYLECKLTRLEENELRLVLATSDMSSPVIDEARDTMAACSLMKESVRNNSVRPIARRTLKWMSAAACIAAALCVGAGLLSMNYTQHRGENVIVYVNGRQLSEEAALKTALETQSMCMKALEQTLDDARKTQYQSMNIINSNI